MKAAALTPEGKAAHSLLCPAIQDALMNPPLICISRGNLYPIISGAN